MRNKLLYLLLIGFFWSQPVVQAATFKTSAWTLSSPALTHSDWYWEVQVVRASDGSAVATKSLTPYGVTYSSTTALTCVLPEQTYSFDFYLVLFASREGLWTRASTSEGVKLQWYSAYEVGAAEPQSSANGPYLDGNPVNPDLSPADPVTAVPVVRSYKANITLYSAPGSLEPRSFRVKGVEDGSNNAFFDRIFTVDSGESRFLTVVHDQPFSLQAVEVSENVAADPATGNTSDDKDKRYIPIAAPTAVASTAQSAAPPTPGVPAVTDSKSAQAGSAGQAAAAHNTLATATTGATSKDISDLDKNLTGEMQRGTAQTKESGDAIKSAIGETNKLLDEIKDGGAGDQGTGEAMEVASAGSLAYVTAIPGKATSLGESLGGLVTSLGLGGAVGSSTLAFSFDFPYFGSTYVNLETYSSLIASIREFLLWSLKIMFVWQCFSIMKESFTK